MFGIFYAEGTFGKEHDAMTGVIKGQAAALVLHKALESFPHSLNFRKQLLEHASTVKFPGCGDIINKIFASIVEDFPEVSSGVTYRLLFWLICIPHTMCFAPTTNNECIRSHALMRTSLLFHSRMQEHGI